MGKISLLTNFTRRLTPADLKGLKYAPIATQTTGKVTKPVTDTFQRSCEVRFKFDDSNSLVFGAIPDEYVNIDRFWVEARDPSKSRFGRLKSKRKEVIPAHWEEYKTLKPSYLLDHLFSHGKGQGKDAVKMVVKNSLNDPRTQGRVTLQAEMIDGKTSPAGFYYKMGFRFCNEGSNEELAKWLAKGGTRENAPMLTGMMYLPKENIEHCLNY